MKVFSRIIECVKSMHSGQVANRYLYDAEDGTKISAEINVDSENNASTGDFMVYNHGNQVTILDSLPTPTIESVREFLKATIIEETPTT